MSGLRLDCGSNIRGPTETVNTRHQQLQQVFRAGAVTTWSPVLYRGQLATTKATSSSRLNPWNTGLAAYLDLALIFLLLRFSLLILFFLHLALIALNHLSCRSESSNKSLWQCDGYSTGRPRPGCPYRPPLWRL